MNVLQGDKGRFSLWAYIGAAAVRTAFGLAWAIDAFLKWQPGFQDNYLSYVTDIITGQPKWLLPWFHLWAGLIQLSPRFFAVATASIESLVAIGLLLGLLRKPVYILGILFATMIWAIPEGFGGPYAPGATDVGGGLIYVFLFVALLIMEYVLGRSPYSVDYYLDARIPWWKSLAEPAPQYALEHEPKRLSWNAQVGVILGLVLMLLVFMTILGSELSSSPPAQGMFGWWV